MVMKRNLETIQLDAFSLLMKENKIHVLYSYYIYIYNYTGLKYPVFLSVEMGVWNGNYQEPRWSTQQIMKPKSKGFSW